MIPIAEVVAGLRRNQFELKFALEREVRVAMEAGAKRAQSFIGDEGTPGWAPLAESTIADKIAQGFDVPAPLKRTGELQRSIHGEAETAFGGVEGVIGTDDPTALFHELGTSRESARPFLGPAMMLTEEPLAVALGELAIRTLTPGGRP